MNPIVTGHARLSTYFLSSPVRLSLIERRPTPAVRSMTTIGSSRHAVVSGGGHRGGLSDTSWPVRIGLVFVLLTVIVQLTLVGHIALYRLNVQRTGRHPVDDDSCRMSPVRTRLADRNANGIGVSLPVVVGVSRNVAWCHPASGMGSMGYGRRSCRSLPVVDVTGVSRDESCLGRRSAPMVAPTNAVGLSTRHPRRSSRSSPLCRVGRSLDGLVD